MCACGVCDNVCMCMYWCVRVNAFAGLCVCIRSGVCMHMGVVRVHMEWCVCIWGSCVHMECCVYIWGLCVHIRSGVYAYGGCVCASSGWSEVS